MNTDRIRELRKSNNLTQKELAQKIQTSDKNIWAYENGIANPPIEILERIADLFEVSVDYLIGREDDFGVSVVAAEPLAANEQELLSCYRQLSPYLQGVALNTVQSWANAAPNGATGKAQKKK